MRCEAGKCLRLTKYPSESEPGAHHIFRRNRRPRGNQLDGLTPTNQKECDLRQLFSHIYCGDQYPEHRHGCKKDDDEGLILRFLYFPWAYDQSPEGFYANQQK